MQNKIFRVAIQVAFVLTLTAGILSAGTLGVAKGYNLFAFNNLTISTDVEGSVAFGGQYSGSLTVGSSLGSNSGGVSLVGDGTNNSNVLASGASINVNGGTSTYLAGYSNSNHAPGVNLNSGAYVTTDPITGGIKNSQTSFISLSAQLTGLAGNANSGYNSSTNTISINGLSCTQCVVDLTAAQAASLDSININQPTQTLIIDITPSGGSVTFNGGINFLINGSQQNNQTTAASTILFNFESATAVTLNSSFFGSILAPSATVNGDSQLVQGEVIANNITGLNETHSESVFNGNLPTGVPEPPSVALLGGALVGLSLFARRLRARP